MEKATQQQVILFFDIFTTTKTAGSILIFHDSVALLKHVNVFQCKFFKHQHDLLEGDRYCHVLFMPQINFSSLFFIIYLYIVTVKRQDEQRTIFIFTCKRNNFVFLIPPRVWLLFILRSRQAATKCNDWHGVDLLIYNVIDNLTQQSHNYVQKVT